MTSKHNYVIYILLLVLVAALLSGCQGATQVPAPTKAPAVPPDPTLESIKNPAQPTVGYPAGVVEPTIAPGSDAYPAADATAAPADNSYPGPSGMPAVENRSKVVAELIEQKAAEDAQQVILHVKVLSSEAIENTPEFTSKLVNQEADLLVNKTDLVDLKAGDKFSAEVSFSGDEHGGKYFAKNLKKQ